MEIHTGMSAIDASLLQLKNTQDANDKNFATTFGVIRINTKMARFLCSNFEESGAM